MMSNSIPVQICTPKASTIVAIKHLMDKFDCDRENVYIYNESIAFKTIDYIAITNICEKLFDLNVDGSANKLKNVCPGAVETILPNKFGNGTPITYRLTDNTILSVNNMMTFIIY